SRHPNSFLAPRISKFLRSAPAAQKSVQRVLAHRHMVTTWNLSVRPTCDASNQVLVFTRNWRRIINVCPVALFGAFGEISQQSQTFSRTVRNACRGSAAAA